MSEKEKGTNNSRFREIISVLRKHNITRGLSPKKLRLIMEDLGPTFVKIGQIMALHSDILPKAYCDELMELCTDARPMPFEEAVSVIDESYGLLEESFFINRRDANRFCINCAGT